MGALGVLNRERQKVPKVSPREAGEMLKQQGILNAHALWKGLTETRDELILPIFLLWKFLLDVFAAADPDGTLGNPFYNLN